MRIVEASRPKTEELVGERLYVGTGDLGETRAAEGGENPRLQGRLVASDRRGLAGSTGAGADRTVANPFEPRLGGLADRGGRGGPQCTAIDLPDRVGPPRLRRGEGRERAANPAPVTHAEYRRPISRLAPALAVVVGGASLPVAHLDSLGHLLILLDARRSRG